MTIPIWQIVEAKEIKSVEKKYLIIDGTSSGKIVCRAAQGDSELRHFFNLFKRELFDKVDDFASNSQVGDSLNLAAHFVIVRWSGEYELFLGK